jgi:hypothetical protein
VGSLDLPDKARLLSPTLSSIGWRRGRKPELDAALVHSSGVEFVIAGFPVYAIMSV